MIEIKWTERELEVNLARDLKVGLWDDDERGGLSESSLEEQQYGFLKGKPYLVNLPEFFEKRNGY